MMHVEVKPGDYVELHRHSTFSTYDGLGKPKVAASYAFTRGQKALALTDHGVVTGIMEHWKACRDLGINPICGVEGYYQPLFSKDAPDYHMTVLVKNQTGWQNLCCLLTQANKETFYGKPIFTWEQLQEYHEGLIVASGCVGGYIPQLIAAKRYEQALQATLDFSQLFGEEYYLEVMPFPVIHGGINIQQEVNKVIVQFAQHLSLPVIMTSDAHYIQEQDYEDYLTFQEMNATNLIADYSHLYMHSAQEMAFAWKGMMGTSGISYIKETRKLADQCEVNLQFKHMVPKVEWEKPGKEKLWEIVEEQLRQMGKWDLSGEETELLQEALALPESLREVLRFAPYAARAAYEFEVICDTEFESYFLMVYEIVNHVRKMGHRCGARGSVCGSLVAYALGITQVDPLILGTYFERFMRKDKRVMPDIDIDFDPEGRAEAQRFIEQQYPGKCAPIANVVYFKTRSLLDKLCKIYPAMSGQEVAALKTRFESIAYDEEPISYQELLAHPSEGFHFQQIDRRFPTLLERFVKFYGEMNHQSAHAAGIMITAEAITKYIPVVWYASGKRYQTAFDMKALDAMGAMKLDCLAIERLGVHLEVEQQTGCTFSYDLLKRADLLKKFAQGATEGTFQFGGSRLMKRMLKRVLPTSFSELMACTALVRPGVSEEAVQTFIDGKTGKTSQNLPWQEITKETYGAFVYQEQAMYACVKLAGMSWGATDKFVKGISKKNIPKDLEEQFLSGLVKKSGLKRAQAEHLYNAIRLYSFNKNHASGYTQLGVYDMYLRETYPAQFWCASLRHTGNQAYKEKTWGGGIREGNTLVDKESEAFAAGQVLLLPHVNGSGNYSLLEVSGATYIRRGLRAIKGLGEKTIERIFNVRGEDPFKGKEDFLERMKAGKKVGVSSKQVMALEAAGALLDLSSDWSLYIEKSIEYCSTLV